MLGDPIFYELDCAFTISTIEENERTLRPADFASAGGLVLLKQYACLLVVHWGLDLKTCVSQAKKMSTNLGCI